MPKIPLYQTSRVKFTRRHKQYMPGDEEEFAGGVAKTLVNTLNVAEFLTRKGEPCSPDGTPLKAATKTADAPKKKTTRKKSTKAATKTAATKDGDADHATASSQG